MGVNLFEGEKQEEKREGLRFAKEDPKSLAELKGLLLQPEKPKTKSELKEGNREEMFYAMLTKDMGTSNITEDEVEQIIDFSTAHNICRMMGLNVVAAFMASEAETLLNARKSVGGWQQDKFNEQRGTYELKGDVKEKLQNAAGVQR